MNEITLKRGWWGTVLAIVSCLYLLAMAGSAQAATHEDTFCWGKTVTHSDPCNSNEYELESVHNYTYAVHARGVQHSICVEDAFSNKRACSGGPNQDVWLLFTPTSEMVWPVIYINPQVKQGESTKVYAWHHYEDPPPPGSPPPPPPNTTSWQLRNSNSQGNPDITYVFQFATGDVAVAGDWNGDGKVTGGAYNPSTGIWKLRNSNSTGESEITFQYGGGPWIRPVVGDWDGDGDDTIGVFDPSTGNWSLRDSNSEGNPDYSFPYGGGPWSKPIAGNWDGIGGDGIGVYDPTAGNWALRNCVCGGNANYSFQYGGGPWSVPLAGNWDGIGSDTIGVADPTTGNWSLRNSNSGGNPSYAFQYGGSQFFQVVGDWDGNKTSTPGLVVKP